MSKGTSFFCKDLVMLKFLFYPGLFTADGMKFILKKKNSILYIILESILILAAVPKTF